MSLTPTLRAYGIDSTAGWTSQGSQREDSGLPLARTFWPPPPPGSVGHYPRPYYSPTVGAPLAGRPQGFARPPLGYPERTSSPATSNSQ